MKTLATKKCTRCGEIKDLDKFQAEMRYKSGHISWCKQCRSEYVHAWYVKNAELTKERSKIWAEENKDKVNISKRKWSSAHKNHMYEVSKIWRSENIDKVRAMRRKHIAKVRSVPKGRLSTNISRNIRASIVNAKGGTHWEELVGFTIDQLKKHLEKRFKPGMTWENYGTYWQIDHKTPVSVFNFEKPEDIDFRLCWSLKNLQPLEAKENNKKRAKISAPFQPALAMG